MGKFPNSPIHAYSNTVSYMFESTMRRWINEGLPESLLYDCLKPISARWL